MEVKYDTLMGGEEVKVEWREHCEMEAIGKKVVLKNDVFFFQI